MHTDKKWLFTEFIERNRSADDIGDECNVTNVTIRWWARKYGFRRRRWGSKNLNELFFDKITTERQAYWLGFLAADGSVQNKPGKRLLSVVLAAKDRIHLELFRDHIDSEHNIYHYERDHECNGYNFHSEVVQLDLASSRLVEGLIKNGIVPNKTETLQAPKLLQRLIRHWIRGYFDGDGSVSISKVGRKRGSFFGNKEVMDFILGQCSFLCGPYPMKNGWSVGFSGSKAKQLYSFLYNRSTVCLERKKNIFKKET